MKEAGRWFITGLLYIWGGFWGILYIVIILTATLLFPLGSYEKLVRYGARTMLFLMGIRLRTEGESALPHTPAIYMSNHVNLFDVFVLGAAIPGLKRGVEAAEHFRWPVWGAMIRRVGNIPIERSNLSEAKKSLSAAVDAVNRGMSIVILPEGHRTRDGGLQEFKKGPFHMAKAAGIPVIPVGLNGMWEIKRYHNPHWRPGKVTARFGAPIQAEKVQTLTVEELREETRLALLSLIDYDHTPRRRAPIGV